MNVGFICPISDHGMETIRYRIMGQNWKTKTAGQPGGGGGQLSQDPPTTGNPAWLDKKARGGWQYATSSA